MGGFTLASSLTPPSLSSFFLEPSLYSITREERDTLQPLIQSIVFPSSCYTRNFLTSFWNHSCSGKKTLFSIFLTFEKEILFFSLFPPIILSFWCDILLPSHVGCCCMWLLQWLNFGLLLCLCCHMLEKGSPVWNVTLEEQQGATLVQKRQWSLVEWHLLCCKGLEEGKRKLIGVGFEGVIFNKSSDIETSFALQRGRRTSPVFWKTHFQASF